MFELNLEPIAKNGPLTERCFGRFLFASTSLQNDPEIIQKIFSKVVPLKMEHDYIRGLFEVSAVSSEFEPTEYGEQIPYYEVLARITVNKKTHKKSIYISFERIKE
jgi:hypothetical protein